MNQLLVVVSSVADRLFIASVIGGLWILLTWGVLRVLPRLPAAFRAALWWFLALKLLLLLLPTPAVEVALLSSPPPPSPTFQQLVAQLRAPGLVSPQSHDYSRLLDSLLGVWCFGVITQLCVTTIQWRRLRGVLRETIEIDPPHGPQRLTSLMSSLGLARQPRVLVSMSISSPIATGWRIPSIILPRITLQNWSARQSDLALAHELAHHKRRDLIWALVPWAARTLFWFHPMAWLAVREYRLATEQACDALALEACQASPKEYGQWLLAMSPVRPSAGWLSQPAASPQFRLLQRRLVMLENTSNGNSRTPLLYLAGALAALAILIPIRVVADDRAPETRPNARQSAEAVAPNRDSAVAALPRDSAEEIDRLSEEIALLAERSAQQVESDSRRGAPTSTVPNHVQRRIQELARRVDRLAQRQAQRGLQLARRGRQLAPVEAVSAAELARVQEEMELAAVDSIRAQREAQRAEEQALARAYAAPSAAEAPSEELY
ncbi:MAG: M56 family metallopeptidase [Acidobacteriota bacterium]